MRIPFLGVEINKGSKVDSLEKKLTRLEDDLLGRPLADFMQVFAGEGIRIPYMAPVGIETMFDVANYSDIIRNILQSLKTEIFRKGYEFEEKFVAKCATCKKEFDYDATECDECSGEDMVHPDPMHQQALEKRFQQVNENEQSLLDVLRCLEDDLNVVDDAYMLVLKTYIFNEDGEIVSGFIKEVLRGDPIFMRIIADKQGRPARDSEGVKIYICPEHRDKLIKEGGGERCSICGKRLYRAYYASKGKDQNDIYYLKGEILHISKFHPSLTYGFPPILTVWQKVLSLMYQDEFIKMYYGEKRSPKGIVFVNTANTASLEKMLELALKRADKNPHLPMVVGIESNSKGGGNAQFLDFMRTLPEMQYIETRNEMRRQIGAVYGVMPLFHADVTTSAGLNNEGLQITVTTRAIESSQAIYNEFLFPRLLEQFGIDDYILKLVPSEEQDEMAELQIEQQKIANATMMRNLGFAVKLNEHNEFEYEMLEQPAQQVPIHSPTPKIPEPEMVDPEQRFEGEPESVRQEAPVTSETEGVYNPTYGGRRNRREKIRKIVTGITSNIAKETNQKLIYKEGEAEELINQLEDNLYRKKFDKVSKKKSDKIKDMILDGITSESDTRTMMNRAMKIETNLTKEEAEMIVRTESQALQNTIREYNYVKADPKDEYKYKWVNPMDRRTSTICQNIVSRTTSGVTLKELKKIIDEEGKKGGFEPRDYMPHINCRSTFVRVF